MTIPPVTRLLLTAAGFSLILGCSKKDAAGDPGNEPPGNETKTASFVTPAATPGGPVLLETSFPLTAVTYKILVGGKPVTLARLEEKQAGFILPVVPTGTVQVDLTAIGLGTQSYTVGKYTPITDAQPVINTFISDLNKAITHLEKQQDDTIRPVPANRVAMAKSMQANFQALYANLTEADKLELAYNLQKMSFDLTDPLAGGRKVAGEAYLRDPADKLVTLGELVITHTTLTVSAMSIAIIGFCAPEPTMLSKALAVGAGLYAVFSLSETWRLIDELAEQIGKHYEFKELSTDGGRVMQGEGANQSHKEGYVNMMNKVAVNFSFQSEYRSFSKQDAQSSNGFIKNVFKGMDKLGVTYDKFVAAVNNAKSWFSAGPPALESYVSPIKATPASAIRVTPSEGIILNNVSVSDIQVTYVANANNTISIKASSETVKTEKDFTFDVVYNHAKLGISNKMTVKATFQPVTNEWIARLVGPTWQLSYYLRMTPEKYQQYVEAYNQNPWDKKYVPAENNCIRYTNYPSQITFRADSTFGGQGSYPYGYQQSVNINAPNKWQVSPTGGIWSRFTAAADKPDFHIVTGQLEVQDANTIKVKMGMFSCDCIEPFSILKKQ